MTPERWQRIDALLEAALERPTEERRRFLDGACGDDGSLRREVEGLLAAAGKLGRFLEVPAAGSGLADARHALDRAGAGESIGPYRVEREIGRGGMGTVYLAVRADDAFRKRVAIKLLHPGTGSAGLVRRFRSERQILATLEHPNIARLLDGGATADGRPYLVMEHIDGLPIDEYCDRHRLPVGARLEIFGRVCEAVHYAHRNLVVHRDIKPSNILVTADGVPRLLDFGIAKLLDPAALPFTVEATLTGMRPMTPSHASPEQVRGEAITTASDVYSLGVLLYQLLTGRLPHDLRALAPREVDRILTDAEPVRPSAAVARTETVVDERGEPRELTPEWVSSRRGTRPQQLGRRLAGDLDSIAAKALRKQASERYGSVEQLLEDLRRHREGLPVLARHGTFGYAVGKFLHRYRLAVGVAGLVLVLGVVFAAAMAHQAAQTARQRDRAEQVTEFLVDIFQIVNPGETRGNTITAREVLDRGAERIERELGDQPEVRADLQDAIGTVYLHLGLYEEAAPLLEAALRSREASHGPEHPDVARSLHRLATLYRHRGRYGEAEPLYRRALAIRERALGPDHPEVAEVLKDLAILLRIQGRYAETEALAGRARAILERSLGTGHPDVADVLRVLAAVRAHRGETGGAESLLRPALDIYERAYGDDHLATAATHHNLAYLLWARDEPAAAEAHLHRALEIYERLLGESHPRIADSLTGLGIAVRLQGRYGEADDYFRRALGIYERAMGADHSGFANCLYELGRNLVLQDRLARAEAVFRRSLDIREDSLGPDHPDVAESLGGLAAVRRRQGRPAEAEELLRRAFAIWEEHPGHPGTAEIPQAFADLLRAAGRPEEAAELEARAAQ